MHRRTSPIVGTAAGLLLISILYLDGVRDPNLMFFTGLTWAIGGWLIARNREVLKNAKSRWKVPLTTLAVVVIFFGIHPDLPMPADLRTSLMLLVLGTSWATAGLGVEIAQDTTTESNATAVTAD